MHLTADQLAAASAFKDFYQSSISDNEHSAYYKYKAISKLTFTAAVLSLAAEDNQQGDNGIPIRARRTIMGVASIANAVNLYKICLTDIDALPDLTAGILHGMFECACYALSSILLNGRVV